MPTWPTSSKPSTTTTSDGTKSISGARGDINQAITNVNTITDFFNLGTPGSGDDNKVLTYDHSSDTISLETNAAAGGDVVDDTTPQLGGDLEVNDKNIQNSGGSNRGDTFIIGSGTTVETSTSTIISGVDSDLDMASNSSKRLCGPVQLTKISDLNAWNDRVHSNAVGTKIELSANFGESGSGGERGRARIRNGYQDITLNTKGFQFGDFAFEKFGDGLNGGFFSAKAFTDVDNGTAHAHTVRAVTLAPQGDGSNDTLTGSNRFTINKLIGAEVVPFVDDKTEVNNFYGVRINADESNNVTGTITNKFSFFSDNANYTFQNDGPAILKGLTFPTSDGTDGQVIKTNGAGTLSFTTMQPSDVLHDLGTLASDGATTTPNFNNGNIQKMVLTRDNGVGGGVKLNAPTNMSDGNLLVILAEASAGTAGQSAAIGVNTGQNYFSNSGSFQQTITSGKTIEIRIRRFSSSKFLIESSNQFTDTAI